jgi:hypothetical protein
MGATLYFLLTGHEPEPITVAHPSLILPMISPELDNIVAKCTAQELSDRYKSAEEIEAELLKLAL